MNGNASEELTLVSSAEVMRSKVRWDIQDFSLICPKDGWLQASRSIVSPEHVTRMELNNAPASDGTQTKTEIEIKWKLDLLFTPSPNPNQKDPKYCGMEVRLVLLTRLPTNLWSVVFKVSLIGQGNAVVLTRSATSLPTTRGEISTPVLSSIFNKELWDNEQTHIVNDTLQLQVELAICPKPKTNQPSVGCHTPASHMEDVIAGMAQLWKSGKDCDLTISCGGRLFKVHSLFVKCRSPVLERMLESGMIESANKSIKIDDVDPADFEALLDYLYTGKLPELGEGASAAGPPFIGLMQVADKYEVLKLRDLCFQKMIEGISMENAGQIAVFAHLHSAPSQVKNAAVNFCLRNWKTLSRNANFRIWTLQNPAAFLPGHE